MSKVSPVRVLIKAIVLFLFFNMGFAALQPPMGRISLYNWLVRGRERFPVSKGPGSYNITVSDLDAIVATHVISGTHKESTEYRVVILGDSQTWGWKQTASETLVAQLNGAGLSACGRQLQFYNLAYPIPSVLRDFLILDRTLEYEPDLVIWMVTTNSFVLSGSNEGHRALTFSTYSERLSNVLHRFQLDRYQKAFEPPPAFWERTIWAQRTALSRLALLQLYGVLWSATDIDYVRDPRSPTRALRSTDMYLGFSPPRLPVRKMMFDVLDAAHEMLGDTPVMVVNEPIYIGQGPNSDLRYNSHYPRWAYDQYHQILPGYVDKPGWHYLDLYDLIPEREFADSEHLKPRAEKRVAGKLIPDILEIACP